jgi:hypothetical protein
LDLEILVVIQPFSHLIEWNYVDVQLFGKEYCRMFFAVIRNVLSVSDEKARGASGTEFN